MAGKLRPFTENELLEKLKLYCPDFKVSHQDIKNPTPEFVKELYRRILLEYNVDINSLVQPHFNQMDHIMPHGEMFQDVIPLINLMSAVNSFGVVPDFGITDLVNPVPKRNLQQMSALMRFVDISDEKLRDIHDKLNAVSSLKAREKELLHKIDVLKERKNNHALRMPAMSEEKSKWEQVFLKLSQEQMTILNDKDVVIREMEKVKAAHDEKMRCIEKLEIQTEEIEDEIRKLKTQIVASPTSIVSDMDALRKKKEEFAEELKNIKDKLQSRKQIHAQLKEELVKLEERKFQLTELVELIQSTQARRKAVKSIKKTLEELTAKVEEENIRNSKLQVKVDSTREELSNLKTQSNTEQDELCKEMEAIKKDIRELEVNKEKALNVQTLLKNLESRIEEIKQQCIATEEEYTRKFHSIVEESEERLQSLMRMLESTDDQIEMKLRGA